MSRQAFASAFSRSFSGLQPAILEEWDEVDEESLLATGGELDKVLALLAERTQRTKALLRRQLEELYFVVKEEEPAEPGAPKTGPGRRHGQGQRQAERGAHGRRHGPEQYGELLKEFEERTAHIVKELRGNLFDGARGRVKENVFFSLLIALGLGFIVGVLFTGGGRGK
jgi:hypothetical protein